jgi:hypothetical protein
MVEQHTPTQRQRIASSLFPIILRIEACPHWSKTFDSRPRRWNPMTNALQKKVKTRGNA